MKLYLATGNPHKVEELRSMIEAAGLPVEVETASAVGGMPEVVEDRDSFSGNAEKKALALAAKLPLGAWALADDSGLCVDALGGAPGVTSARYAGLGATDDQNIDKLLEALDAIEERNRAAAFVCCLALARQGEQTRFFKGSCPGEILHERRGVNGFGYDPVFEPAGLEQSFAELSEGQKAQLSHRGNAMRKLVSWLGENPELTKA